MKKNRHLCVDVMAKFTRRRLVVGGDDDDDDGGGKSQPRPEGLDKHYRVPLLFVPPSSFKNIGLTNVEFFFNRST